MSLSKKNRKILNSYIENKKSNQNNNKNLINNSNLNHVESNNQFKEEDINKIFYTIIDNADNIYHTNQTNMLLKYRENEMSQPNKNELTDNNELSPEDKLYDEFNYLLED